MGIFPFLVCFEFGFSFGGIRRTYLHKQVFFVSSERIKLYFPPTFSILIGMHVTGGYLKMDILSSWFTNKAQILTCILRIPNVRKRATLTNICFSFVPYSRLCLSPSILLELDHGCHFSLTKVIHFCHQSGSQHCRFRGREIVLGFRWAQKLTECFAIVVFAKYIHTRIQKWRKVFQPNSDVYQRYW